MFFVFAIISFSIAYKRASSNGRNGYFWGLIASIVFILTGLSISFGVGVFVGIGIEAWNWQPNVVDFISITGSVIAVIASFSTTWLIFRFLGSSKEESS